MKALPWILAIVAVLIVIYFVYNNRKKAAAALNGAAPGTTAEPSIFGSSAPPVQIDPCLSDPQVLQWITAYPTAMSQLKPVIKQALMQKCPQAASML